MRERGSWVVGCGLALALSLQGAEPHLQNLKQLTFGGANAEAYFSPDGRRLIFQSTRDGRRCDQIYVMKVDGSEVRMVSTGRGRTTCGFFLPDGKHILYSSTHEASPDCPPEVDRSKGYLWPVYPEYEIYKATDDGQIVGKLNPHPGYDAEATVNWKKKLIVWTSVRDGDLNLWTMDLNSGRQRQVTRRLGYDGGAFFSPDGKKLVWRAYYPPTPEAEKDYRDKLAQNLTAPMKMEIFVSDADGKNARQVTRFGCASFAPVFTPDGKKIIFASNKNKCDSRYFELFLMNLDGTGLEQVTDSGGFTSFPMFSPDGKKLVFISERNAKARYEFNIFISDWK